MPTTFSDDQAGGFGKKNNALLGGIDSDEHPWIPIILMFAKGMGLRSLATSTPYVSNTWLLDHVLRWLLVQWSVIAPAIHAWLPTAMSPIGCCCKHGSRVTRIDRQIGRLNKNNPTPQCNKKQMTPWFSLGSAHLYIHFFWDPIWGVSIQY